jgi:hypothetical protein
MAYEIEGVYKITFPASGNLSTLQYHFVTLNSSGQVIAITADTDIPVGILQNAPTTGQAAEIMLRGVSKLACVTGLTNGDLIGPDATGYGITRSIANNTDNLHWICGTALETTAAVDQIGAVLLIDPWPHMRAI